MFNSVGRLLRGIHSSWRSIDVAAVAIRAAVGMCFIAHGGSKLFPWLGSQGITSATAEFHEMGYSAPHVFAIISGLVEFISGILIAVGFVTPLAAIALIIEMLVAIWTVAYAEGFFGAHTTYDGGWELNAYLIGLLIALLVIGPGRFSIDSLLGLTRQRTPAAAPTPSSHAGQAGAAV